MAASETSIAIIYGFAEGPAIGKQLLKAIGEHGYHLKAKPEDADIIIAHSGGAWLLPENLEHKLVVLLAPSVAYNGGPRAWAGAMSTKIWQDYRQARRRHESARWLLKSSFNIFYILTKPLAIRRMLQAGKTHRGRLPVHNAAKTVVVSYKSDPWSKHIHAEDLERLSDYTFLSHTGLHDDLWNNPQEYLTVIQYLYEPRVLAQTAGR